MNRLYKVVKTTVSEITIPNKFNNEHEVCGFDVSNQNEDFKYKNNKIHYSVKIYFLNLFLLM